MSIELAFTDVGPLDPAGDSRTVVLLHAFPLDRRMWSRQLDALSIHHRVIAPDLRGFGSSPLGQDEPDLDEMADDIAELLGRLGISSCVLAGLSLGGYVTMAFLRRHGSVVESLVLLDTKATADGDEARNNRERIASTVEGDGSVDVLRTDVLPALTGSTTKAQHAEVVAALASMVESASPAAVAWTQRAMAARSDSVATLEEFDGPALIVVGDEDVLSPMAEAQIMFDALPDAELAVIPECGHLSAMERPHDVNEILLDHLVGLSVE